VKKKAPKQEIAFFN